MGDFSIHFYLTCNFPLPHVSSAANAFWLLGTWTPQLPWWFPNSYFAYSQAHALWHQMFSFMKWTFQKISHSFILLNAHECLGIKKKKSSPLGILQIVIMLQHSSPQGNGVAQSWPGLTFGVQVTTLFISHLGWVSTQTWTAQRGGKCSCYGDGKNGKFPQCLLYLLHSFLAGWESSHSNQPQPLHSQMFCIRWGDSCWELLCGALGSWLSHQHTCWHLWVGDQAQKLLKHCRAHHK